MATATSWPEANNKFKQHLTDPSNSGTTMATTGINGNDIGISIHLGGTRVLWLFGDSFWVQAGALRSSLVLIRNPVALQTGTLDLSTCTLTYHVGGTAAAPLDFFPPVMRDGQPMWKYPMGGIFLDDRVLVTGMLSFGTSGTGQVANFSTTMSGLWATMLYDISGNNPVNWQQQDLRWGGGHDSFHVSRQFTPACNPVDGGDGFIYFYCFGPSRGAQSGDTGGGEWAVFRIPRDDVKKGDLTRPRWFDGVSRWVEDYQDARTTARIRNRRNMLGFAINGSDQFGGVHRRGDGTWQVTGIPTGWFGSAPEVGYSLAATPATRFTTYTKLWNPAVQSGYTPPNGGKWYTLGDNVGWGDFIYGAYSYPEQTWSGKGANDQLIAFSRNRQGPGSLNLFSDSRAYWVEFYKVTGISP